MIGADRAGGPETSGSKGENMKALALLTIAVLASSALWAGDPASEARTFSLAAVQEPTSVAERYLFELALASKKGRRLGYVLVVGGAALVAGGFALAGSADDGDDLEVFFDALGAAVLWASGAVAIIGGTATLIIASGPERRYAVVKSLPDPLHREQASREALHDLARSGKVKRLIIGGAFSALAVYSLAAGDESQAALVPGALAAFQFLIKSREERTYARYLAAGGLPPDRINVGVGPGPRGGFRVAVVASF